MVPRSEPAFAGLASLLRGLVAAFRRTSEADIVSLFLYDADAGRYYAPFALGQPEESLLDSLGDMQAQLGRYRADVAQGKVPDELTVPQYGSTVWLTVTRRPLVARDAATEIDSTFVRRHHVASTVGLPLLAGDELLGLVYRPAATHLPTLARYYDLSDVVLIEKPLGSPPDEYRRFLERVPGGVELVAADHYYFKLEVRLLQLLLTEERTLRDFLDSVQEVCIEILEAQPLAGAAADIGVVADLLPHALAIISLLTPIDRLQLDAEAPLLVGRHEGAPGERETYARLSGTFPYRSRTVRLVVDVGKGVEDAKWIRLSGERRASGRSPFYKFDFANGEAIDGTQSTVRAAVRKIREPGVPDNAHLTMLRHVIERRHPAVGILSIREAIRANQRIRQLEALAGDLIARGDAGQYAVGTRPAFAQPRESPSPVGGGG